MLVPIDWLKEYTDVNVSTDEFCEKMIMSGSNLETCTMLGQGIQGVVVGKFIKIDAHPDAQKLSVCTVDVGGDAPLQIVCGAQNIFEGALVPVALDGSVIPGPMHGQPKQAGGVTIRKGALRGVESMGMICATSELGYEDKVIPVSHKDGVWILPEGLTPGQDVVEAMGLASAVVDFEITPNRPDCLSMIGMARESAATFKENLRYPETKCQRETENAAEYMAVSIARSDLCSRYAARIVTDVKIGPSPWWMQKKLMYAGMRPINNIVDITNFVMLEFGQPIHAFDIREITGRKIVVDTAKKGETFVTLDGNERKLTDTMLMIKDGTKSVAIAGVMGGLDSGIMADTTTILIESANFNGDNIRATSKRLGLRTEASSRFEKGIDPNLCEAAANRVCKLIEELGAGNVVSGLIDAYPQPALPVTIGVRVKRVNDVLGITLSTSEMKDFFERLEMKAELTDDACYADPSCHDCAVLKVTPPTVRQDLLEEVDFIEEVARLYGYDLLPVTIPRGSSRSTMSRDESLRRLATQTLCALGANEIQTYSFVSPKGVDNVGIAEDSWERNFAVLRNPLGEENSVMRTILTPALLETLGRNFSRSIENVKAFEIGKTFSKNLIDPEGLPDEQDALAIGCYGKNMDFFVLKGMIVELLRVMGIHEVVFTPEEEYGVYHPGRCARISLEGEELGIMGEVHPDVADRFEIGTRCYCAEFMFDAIMRHAKTDASYSPLPKYPSTSRDIALLVDESQSVGVMEQVIRLNGEDILEQVRLFDIYRGAQVAEGKKSVAFTLTYRDANKTLTDEDVAKVHNKILVALKETFNAVLREI
jgi:phenylalanyl-tRNA synthetase beta chain